MPRLFLYLFGAFIAAGANAEATLSLGDGISDLANQVAAAPLSEASRRIAVVPFVDISGARSPLGDYLAEELTTKLFKTGRVMVVERALRDKVLQELKLGESGVVDPLTARQAGKITGAAAIVTGTIANLERFVSINCRLIDTESGRVVAAASAKIAKDGDVRKILGESSSSTPAVSEPRDSRSERRSSLPPPESQQLVPGVSVDVSSVANRRGVYVATFTFHNTTNKPYYLALMSSNESSCADFHLTDGRGGFCQACANGEVLSSLRKGGGFGWGYFLQNFALLSGTAQHVVNFHRRFCSSEVIDAASLTVSGSFFLVGGEQADRPVNARQGIRASVSFSGIRAAGR